MGHVVEARALPERHLYTDPVEATDEESEPNDESVVFESTPAAVGQVNFKEFLNRLVRSAKIYGQLVLVRTNEPETDRHLRNLKMIKAVQTYGFLMHLYLGGCSKQHFREVLTLTESFVLRRHICRERSNETEALFAKLCAVNPKNPVHKTREAYRELCPTDDKFQDEFSTANFTANLIDRARYCLEQIEISKHGNYAELQVLGADDVHVEHIMPQKIKTNKAKLEFGDWVEYLGDNAESQHQKYVSRIGNLTLFAGTLNIGASNNPFHKKRNSYKKSSIKLTQDLGKKSKFNFEDIDQRAKSLAEIAVGLWPKP